MLSECFSGAFNAEALGIRCSGHGSIATAEGIGSAPIIAAMLTSIRLPGKQVTRPGNHNL